MLWHRVRDCIRRTALRQLEAHTRFLHTFGDFAGAMDRRACITSLERFHGETTLSVVQGLLAGATWTASEAVR